ncbi:MAG: L,D-transpeptidase [Xenococcaceae cyanobacterium MO_167.B52]|nr:L,D-transpeptidase [Xenococcaceae cyanobacterium MO_167.B52]
MKKHSLFQNLIRCSFLIFAIGSLYYLLNKRGYIPPVKYLFSQVTVKNNLELVSRSTSSQLLNYQLPITEIITTPIDKSQTAILIEKSQYHLTIYYQNQAVKSYPVVFGKNPVGDKLQEGDLKTPEGIFKVRDLYPHPSWSKFIWLDYPNDDSWSKHLEAKKSGKIKMSASIGGEIGIHGVPDNGDLLIDTKDNWTWGCISLKNKDVDEIYSVIQTGTIVKIIP